MYVGVYDYMCVSFSLAALGNLALRFLNGKCLGTTKNLNWNAIERSRGNGNGNDSGGGNVCCAATALLQLSAVLHFYMCVCPCIYRVFWLYVACCTRCCSWCCRCYCIHMYSSETLPKCCCVFTHWPATWFFGGSSTAHTHMHKHTQLSRCVCAQFVGCTYFSQDLPQQIHTQSTATSHIHARFLPTYVAKLTLTLTSRKKTGNSSASSMSFALPLPLQSLTLSFLLALSHVLFGAYSLI